MTLRAVAQGSGSGSGTVTSVATGTGLFGGPITGAGTISITATGVTLGTYGNATNAPVIAVNAQGQITSASTVALNVGTVTQIATGTGLTPVTITSSGTISVSSNVLATAIVYVFDGAGSTLTPTGVKGDLVIPFAATIQSATLQADQSGFCVFDIWKKAYTATPAPTVAASIVASAPPTLSSAQAKQDTTLTGWTTTMAANDMLRFNLNSTSSAGLTRVVLTLNVQKT